MGEDNAVINICCCFLCCVIMLISAWYPIYTGEVGKREGRATSWAQPGQWASAQCTVLNTGIASRSSCYDFERQDRVQYFSECTGWKFCSAEGENCECEGQVAYLPDYNLIRGFVPDNTNGNENRLNNERMAHFNWEKVDATGGEIKCGHGTGGPFREDPAPGVTKACWCKPKEIDRLMSGQHVRAWQCGEEADDLYASGRSSEVLAEPAAGDDIELEEEGETYVIDSKSSARGLLSRRPVLPSTATKDEAEPEDLLEVQVKYFQRRRKYGGCPYQFYEPWALVNVTVTENGKASTHLRCANQFGVPLASRTIWEVAQLNESRWNSFKGTSVPCYVRSTSASAGRRLSTPDCDDDDFGKYDSRGQSCEHYSGSWCGKYDNDDFDSRKLCCTCGGGVKVGGQDDSGAGGGGGGGAADSKRHSFGGGSKSGDQDNSGAGGGGGGGAADSKGHSFGAGGHLQSGSDVCAVSMGNPNDLPGEEVGVKEAVWSHAYFMTILFFGFWGCMGCVVMCAIASTREREKSCDGEFCVMQDE